MTLNSYKDEVKDFLVQINAQDEGIIQKLAWLEEEYTLLKEAANVKEADKLRHQVYDMLFILLEIAAECDFDLDNEWDIGRRRKENKYISATTPQVL